MREKKHQAEKQDKRKEMGLKVTMVSPFSVTAVSHHFQYGLQEHFDPGPCTNW